MCSVRSSFGGIEPCAFFSPGFIVFTWDELLCVNFSHEYNAFQALTIVHDGIKLALEYIYYILRSCIDYPAMEHEQCSHTNYGLDKKFNTYAFVSTSSDEHLDCYKSLICIRNGCTESTKAMV